MIDHSLSGHVIAEFEFPITSTKVKEFSTALKNPNPLYVNKSAAQSEGYDNVLMPITFPSTFPFYIDMEDAVMDAMKLLGMNEKTSVHGEVNFIMERTIQAGEQLRTVMQVGKIFEKQKSNGSKMTFVEIVFNYFDHADKLVGSMVNLFIEKSEA